MIEKVRKHFNKEELKSIILSFFSVAFVEAIFEWNNLFATNFSKEALIALGSALLKSFLKAIYLVEIKPKLMTQTQTTTTVVTTDPPAAPVAEVQSSVPVVDETMEQDIP